MFQWPIELFGQLGYLGNRVIWSITLFGQWGWLNNWLFRQVNNSLLVSLAYLRFSAWVGNFGEVIFHLSQAMFQWAIELFGQLGYLGNWGVIWKITLFGQWGWLNNWLFRQVNNSLLVSLAYLRFSAWVGNFGEVIFHFSQAIIAVSSSVTGASTFWENFFSVTKIWNLEKRNKIWPKIHFA